VKRVQEGGVLGHVGSTSEVVCMMLFGSKWAIQESLTQNFDVSWQGKVTMGGRGDEDEWRHAGSVAWLCQHPGTVMHGVMADLHSKIR